MLKKLIREKRGLVDGMQGLGELSLPVFVWSKGTS
jgi:hypothetical protein